MEHRCTERYSSDLKIIMVKHNIPIAVGRIKNGNRWGVFIETDCEDLECEHQITLQIKLDGINGVKQAQLEMNAIVIHKSLRGFGMELDIETQKHADLFIEMLKNLPKPPQAEPLFAMVANS